MKKKGLLERANYQPTFDGFVVGQLVEQFKKPIMVHVFKTSSGFYNWTSPFFKDYFEINHPVLIQISKQVQVEKKEFDCREWLKSLIKNEVIEYRIHNATYQTLIKELKIDITEQDIILRDDDGVIYHPNSLFDIDFLYLESKKSVKDYLLKLETLSKAHLLKDENGKLISWDCPFVIKDKRSFTLYDYVNDMIKVLSETLLLKTSTLDISGLIKVALLRQLLWVCRDLNSPLKIQKKNGLKSFLDHFDITQAELEGSLERPYLKQLNEQLCKKQNIEVSLSSALDNLNETMSWEDFPNSKANGVLTISLNESVDLNKDSLLKAISSLRDDVTKVFQIISENYSEGYSEEIYRDNTITSDAQWVIMVERKDLGLSFEQIHKLTEP